MSLFGELITTVRLPDLSSCRSLCGIPASTTRKRDLIEALQLQGRCPHKRRALLRHLMERMTANSLRSWISCLRPVGFRVPDSKVMGRGQAEIMDAIIRLECPAGEYFPTQGGEVRDECPAGEYSPAQGGEVHDEAQGQGASATGQADSAGAYSSAQSGEVHQNSMGSHDVGMVLVAYDATSSPAASRKKLGKRWLKLAQKAYKRSQMPRRVRRAVEEALRENPDATVLTLRGVVESKVGVDLRGKYGVLFDKALLSGTAAPEKPSRPRKRFSLAVDRRRAKQAPAS